VDVLRQVVESRVQLAFDLACQELDEARRAQQLKDTPAVRLRVAECRAAVDRVLDRWNDFVLTPA